MSIRRWWLALPLCLTAGCATGHAPSARTVRAIGVPGSSLQARRGERVEVGRPRANARPMYRQMTGL
jgi:hypothetical protein